MIITLEPDANPSLLKKMIKNMKGVGKVVLKKNIAEKNLLSVNKADKETEKWIREMKILSNSFNPDLVDKNDDRTNYLLSK